MMKQITSYKDEGFMRSENYPEPTRVLLVDDDELVRFSLQMIIEADTSLIVAGQAAGGEQALALYQTLMPDVVMMDIRMQPMDGLQTGEALLNLYPDARILYLTTFLDDDYIVRALRLGARGYMLKQDYASIIPAIKAVCQNQSVFGDTIIDRVPALLLGHKKTSADPLKAGSHKSTNQSQQQNMANAGAGPEKTNSDQAYSDQAYNITDADNKIRPMQADSRQQEESEIARVRVRLHQLGLTEREIDIIEGIAQGYNNKELASWLAISEGTVRNHLSVILDKLQLRDRTQLAIFYFKQG